MVRNRRFHLDGSDFKAGSKDLWQTIKDLFNNRYENPSCGRSLKSSPETKQVPKRGYLIYEAHSLLSPLAKLIENRHGITVYMTGVRRQVISYSLHNLFKRGTCHTRC